MRMKAMSSSSSAISISAMPAPHLVLASSQGPTVVCAAWSRRGVVGADRGDQFLDAGEQLVRIEGFAEVVVGAGVVGGSLLRGVLVHREDQDGQAGGGSVGAQQPADVEAVDAGQPRIHDQ